MSDKTIRVSRETWEWLRDLKREEESFDEVLARLRKRDRWSGFGALAETGVSDGMEQAHDQLETELQARVDEGN